MCSALEQSGIGRMGAAQHAAADGGLTHDWRKNLKKGVAAVVGCVPVLLLVNTFFVVTTTESVCLSACFSLFQCFVMVA